MTNIWIVGRRTEMASNGHVYITEPFLAFATEQEADAAVVMVNRVGGELPIKTVAELMTVGSGSLRPAANPSPATYAKGPVNCNTVLIAQDKTHPRTCARCGLGPCPFFDKHGFALPSPKDPS